MTIQLSDLQTKVLASIVEWYRLPVKRSQVFYLYGYAGTGKSTIVERAIEELKAHCNCKDVITAAYTGKAASVLQKKGVKNAQTIHSLLYIPQLDEKGNLYFVKRDVSDGDFADLIVLDECSMIGQDIAADILALGRKVLVIGDPGQLPPISGDPGFHTHKPDAFLTEIHRQAAESPIIRLATMVRNGERLPLKFEEGDVKILPLNWENREYIFNPETQVIGGTHKTRYNYTQAIRNRFNIFGEKPVAGEKIICCKTNYKYGFFNGFMGISGELEMISSEKVDKKGGAYKAEDWHLDVYLEDLEKPRHKMLIDPYLFQNHFNNGQLKPLEDNNKNYGLYSEFDWAYVITCHKAQGSSFDHVTVIDDSDVFKENQAKWLYTSLTRAERGLTLLSRKYK